MLRLIRRQVRKMSSAAAPVRVPLLIWLLIWLVGIGSAGCINAFTMIGKTLVGDPHQTSFFRQQTGIDLAREKAEVAVVCTTSFAVMRDFDALHLDLQNELQRRLSRRKITVSDANTVLDALMTTNGRFDENVVSRAVPNARFLFHIELSSLSTAVPSSPTLRQGKAEGLIRGYEVRTDPVTGVSRPVQVFEQGISMEYPTQPVPVERLSEKIFLRQFIDRLTDRISQVFYDVSMYDLHRI